MRYLFFLLFSTALLIASPLSEQDQTAYQLGTLRAAVTDLQQTWADEYPKADHYLKHLSRLERQYAGGKPIENDLHELRREALLANPLLRHTRLLCIKRKMPDLLDVKNPAHKKSMFGWGGKVSRGLEKLGLPSNHECNSSLAKTGYDNCIAMLPQLHPDAELQTVYTPVDSGYVGEIDLHWDASKLLFTESDSVNWKVFELNLKNNHRRQVSQTPADVDCGDACYLPNGNIVFGSTASMQSVPCWHGKRRVSNLYVMKNDGSGMRQLCFDQDHNFHPSVLANGQVLYHRWDYTGISHIFFRQLMVMNPDGSGQRAIYGSNSWFPNSLYFPRALPGSSSRLISILSGYHGAHRMGQLVVVDTQKGFHEEQGLVQRISGRGQRIEPKIRDNLVDDDWPKFLHPYPLSENYFLVSAWLEPSGAWGIYLADVFDNLLLIKEIDGYALLEPVPLVEQQAPPIVPNRVRPEKDTAVFYLHDVYAGPGLDGVPREVVKSLRIFSYDFGYPGLAGPHKIGIGGPWEATRILGTVPLETDGSVMFKAPANTPLAFQALDEDGKAVQLMRSWVTGMPGETVSCIGCHESPAEVAPTRRALAALKRPQPIRDWYGPARGFDFEREVQPVLNRHCVGCHNGSNRELLDLRAESKHPDYLGSFPSTLGVRRMHPAMKAETGGRVKYTPAYEALLPYVRRVSIEDDVSLLLPGDLHADTSPLVQLLKRGHHGVKLDDEAWDRLVTWIDLNAPCHGTWGDVFPVQDGMCERRRELQTRYGGPPFDPEVIPETPPIKFDGEPAPPIKPPQPARMKINAPQTPAHKTIRLPNDETIQLVKIPATPPFWISETEISNAQFRAFDPRHDSRYYSKRHRRHDDKGIDMNEDTQPVVRVSWRQASEFCEWLTASQNQPIKLPTLEQWAAAESGNRVSTFSPNQTVDYSLTANLADTSFSHGFQKNGLQISGGVEHLHLEGADLADTLHNDSAVVTAAVGSYQPNEFGLYDIIGNAAEWMRDVSDERAFAVGGSFFDHPRRIRPVDYPTWQRVFNVGFRIVMEAE